jgi:hypothetical protein
MEAEVRSMLVGATHEPGPSMDRVTHAHAGS